MTYLLILILGCIVDAPNWFLGLVLLAYLIAAMRWIRKIDIERGGDNYD